jgi:hypothetical protein
LVVDVAATFDFLSGLLAGKNGTPLPVHSENEGPAMVTPGSLPALHSQATAAQAEETPSRLLTNG